MLELQEKLVLQQSWQLPGGPADCFLSSLAAAAADVPLHLLPLAWRKMAAGVRAAASCDEATHGSV